MELKALKASLIAILGLYLLYLAAHDIPQTVLWFVDTIFHEAGHWIFALFGENMAIAGGSIMQLLVPTIFAGYFIIQKQYYSASIMLLWLGENFLSVAAYAADAVKMVLPLLGGDSSTHDWNALLINLGLLPYTDTIAGTIKLIGVICIICAGIWGMYSALKSETNGSNF